MIKGEIKYNLFTVTGTKEVKVEYVLTGEVMGEIVIKDCPVSDIDEDTMEEIVGLCLEDADKHSQNKAARGYDFSQN